MKQYNRLSWCLLFFCTGSIPPFPHELQKYGLTESILTKALLLCSQAKLLPIDVGWFLKETPAVGFYRELHMFLKKWPLSQTMTKVALGRFYLSIDPQLYCKGTCGRPDNVYQFIERVVSSDRAFSSPMSYGHNATVRRLVKEKCVYSNEVEELSSKVKEQQEELIKMKTEVEVAKAEVSGAKCALSDVMHQLQIVKKQRDTAYTKVRKYQDKLEVTVADFVHFEDQLFEKNDELTKLVCDLKGEIAALSSSNVTLLGSNTKQSVSFCFQTKDGGKVYTHAIRELYYSLLSNEIPPGKIEKTIRAVLTCFFPSLKLDSLQLPSESCASYMRRHELATLSLAHKATSVLKQAETGFLHLNTDGTTKCQKKIEGAALNGMVLSVNEVPDGSADSMIDDISRELEKLRDIARALRLPNSDKINWTLIISSSSDSASTQKRFNKLLEEKRARDADRFGELCPEVLELVENFCSMHLGVNLRKAFLDGIRCLTTDSCRDRYALDTIIHEFCKLFSKHGVPEYGHGVLAFPDFLKQSTSGDKMCYYQICAQIRLDRQVGSRYFVSASNAGKILFLRKAALEFLVYTGKSDGNKLEQDVYEKLQDPDILSQLKADALMFHHVYSNLVMLAKSNELMKSAFDMRCHYLELRMFLEGTELNPQITMDRDLRVFASEGRLYGPDKKCNHRLHNHYEPIEQQIFTSEESDSSLLYPLLVTGAKAMKEKLSKYAHSMLPGGKYWEPDPDTKAVLQQLRPSNDLCESILGLNDYLSTAIPNLHQLSRSNLIEVKKKQDN